MKRWTRCALAAAVVLAACFAAQAAKEKEEVLENENGKRTTSPSLVQIQDKPGLPRVMLLGDSISMGYTLMVRKGLEGKANVHRPPTNCGSTTTGLAKIDEWLGKGKWDVIHFNFGIHDLKYIKTKKGGVEVEVQNTPPAKYEANLRALVARLKKTGATLVFATTTPIPENCRPPNRKVSTDVAVYNNIAKKVMEENGVRIDDLYSYVLPKVEEYQIPKDVHFHSNGSEYMSKQVVKSILEALETRAKATSAPATQP